MKKLLAAAAFALAVAAVLHAQVPVFSSGTEVVRIDVSVLKDGVPVEGLGAAEFEVKDNGVRQTVEIVGDTGESKQVDTVLALDLSDSVRGRPLEQLKTAAHAFVGLLRPEDSFSLLTFSSQVRLAVSPADSRSRAHEVIDATQAQLTTSLYDAAFAAVVTADPGRGRPLALVLSDGEDHGSWLKPQRVLRAAEASELVVHVIFTRAAGVRPGSEPPFLGALAEATGGQEWRADYEGLPEVLRRALEEFRSRYTLRYERGTEVSRSGWHQFDVRVRRPGVKVRARAGYFERAGPGESRR